METRKNILTLLIVLVAVCRTTSAQIDDTIVNPIDDIIVNPGDPPPKTLKFQQLPMNGPTNPNDPFRYYGHDSVSTAYSKYNLQTPVGPQLVGYRGCFRADDFADYADTPAICVKWWGSYINNEIYQPVEKFLIAFEEDVPAGVTGSFGHPGAVLSSEIVHLNTSASATCDTLNPGEYIERMVGPGGPPCNEELYEYCAVLQKPFPQKPNTVYWIKIVALVDLPPTEAGSYYNCIDQTTGNGDGQLSNAELRNYLEHQPQNYCDLTRWGWHNRDYRFEDIYASHKPHVVPGEELVGKVVDPVTGISHPVWHFQSDAVTGEVIVDIRDPFDPIDPDLDFEFDPIPGVVIVGNGNILDSTELDWNFESDSIPGIVIDNPGDPLDPTGSDWLDVIQPRETFKEEYYIHQSHFCDPVSETGVDGPQEIVEFSLDLAFELWTEEVPPPPTPEHELGDAPDQSNNHGAIMMAFPGVPADYPTVFGAGAPVGPLHLDPLSGAFLGAGVTRENEADLLPDQDGVTNIDPPADVPDQDHRDDSVHFPLNLRHCERNRFDYDVTIVAPQNYYVNVWFDWNQNGNWRDTLTCSGAIDTSGASIVPEWAVQNQWIDGAVLGAGLHTITTPDFIAWNIVSPNVHPETWMRIQISEQPWTPNTGVGVGGDGPAAGYQFGETEDYLALIGCRCRGDVADATALPGPDGQVSFGDLNYIINILAPTFAPISPVPPNLLCADVADVTALPGPDGQVSFGDLNYMIIRLAPTFAPTGCLP